MSEHFFRTIYFPRARTRAGKSVRVTVSLPAQPDGNGVSDKFLSYARSISSRDLRLAMGDPVLDDLEQNAHADGRSLSAVCLRLLSQNFQARFGTSEQQKESQLSLPFANGSEGDDLADPTAETGLFFRESKRQRVHGWYPYVEGFSATYVRDAMLRTGVSPKNVFDPFGGAGTTQVVASSLGVPSYFAEINPLMTFVAETKVNSASWARKHFKKWQELAEQFLRHMNKGKLEKLGEGVEIESVEAAFPERDFFVKRDLRHLLAARDLALRLSEGYPHARSLLLLAVAANAVASSNMTRRADLRRRRDDEYKTRVVDVAQLVGDSIRRMMDDISHLPTKMEGSIKVADDCRDVPPAFNNAFEFAVTSPPYLNGTNYFRNTKIELWLLGFIQSEKELAGLCRRAVAGGINNVTLAKQDCRKFEFVEPVASKLDAGAGDRRIPLLVRRYFSDMHDVLAAVYRCLVPGKLFLLDIGDSRFYGVHVPTDKLLCRVAEEVGFKVDHQHVLARRYSRDKTELSQIELVLRKPAGPVQVGFTQLDERIENRIRSFATRLPYKAEPYSSRSWGHVLHSLCSYQGKLKPSLAYWTIKEFVSPEARVLDPLGGVGTVAFEAALAGCHAVSNDKSPLAALIATAKLNPPSNEEAEQAVRDVERRMRKVKLTKGDRADAAFGLNATVSDYYHPDTLEEVLRARRVFLTSRVGNRAENFVWASLLHILHGNRPYALSRTSHPVTPFHPTGPAEYRPLIQKVRDRISRALAEALPDSFRSGVGIEGDFRDLPTKYPVGSFDAIITSPPFVGMRFDRPNWLRLWFCGWGESDFHKTSLGFLERQQSKSRECYVDFFSVCRTLIAQNGLLIIHLGSGGRGDLVGDLKKLGSQQFSLLEDVTENVQAVEQHGLRDKGLTTTHHLLFFRPS